MGQADHFYADGDWDAQCSMCGHKFKASQLKKHWQGFWRCPTCWEPRHPQDFVKAIPERQAPPWIQPPSQTFIKFCTPNGRTAIADFAVADCAIADYIDPAFDSNVEDD